MKCACIALSRHIVVVFAEAKSNLIFECFILNCFSYSIESLAGWRRPIKFKCHNIIFTRWFINYAKCFNYSKLSQFQLFRNLNKYVQLVRSADDFPTSSCDWLKQKTGVIT